jgi:hypothetical protein
MKELLSRLINLLSESVRAWERFNSPDGGISYFSDIDSGEDVLKHRSRRRIRAINETFQDLEDFQKKLIGMDKECQTLAQTVSPIGLTASQNLHFSTSDS